MSERASVRANDDVLRALGAEARRDGPGPGSGEIPRFIVKRRDCILMNAKIPLWNLFDEEKFFTVCESESE